ncbi:hypothetical protein R3P38DRAFT_2935581 [Favolaschia claudopus]|uniref:Uncharacterized protein n=1 Tax=Favolaschia claudopus TaxID=2862362 RepID=A0AAW0BQ30_9AGAR
MRRLSLSLVLAAGLSNALVNITVDGSDGSSVSFTPQNCQTTEPTDEAERSWQVSPGKTVHSERSWRRCDQVDARITLNFTGIAVYLIYPPSPDEMTISVALDSNHPELVTIPARAPSEPSSRVWGLSGLPDTEHLLTIRGLRGSASLSTFMYTSLCDSSVCRRRKGGTEPEESDEGDEDPPPPPASSNSAGSSSASAKAPSSSSSVPSSIVSASSQPPPSSSNSADPLSAPLPTDAIVQVAPHRDTVGIIVGAVLGSLGLVCAALALLLYHRFRRRTVVAGYVEQPSPPYTASVEEGRPPSMRERSDRFSDTHTPAGTPLTRSPGRSLLTSLSSHSMGLAHLKTLSTTQEKSPESVTHDDANSLEIPPPGYDNESQA